MRLLGVVFQPASPPEALIEVAGAVEAAGVPELWVWEDCFREAGIAQASLALAATSRLRVGIGVLPMPLRNVAITAMELATLGRVFPGRIVGGVGHGVQSWMAQVGARHASMLTLMDEYLPALRSLLAGERITCDGSYVHLDDVALDWPPAHTVPVFAAAEGPKTLARAGALADGTIIPGGWSPARLREAVATVRDAAGVRGAVHRIVCYLPTRFTGAAADGQLDPEARIEVSGEAAVVAATVERFFQAGADTVVLEPYADEADLAGFAAGAGEVARMLGIGARDD